MGNPMVKTGWYSSQIFELASGALLPRMINGDRTPDGWFYEGNQDVRRNSDGDLFVATDQSVTQIGAAGANLLAHFPQRGAGGNLNSGSQVAANTSGTVVMLGSTNFGPQHLSTLKDGVANVIAWLGGNAPYRTAAPGGGFFLSSSDIGVDDSGTVYANLRVTGATDGLFAWTPGADWSAVLKVGDLFNGRAVTSINSIRVAGTICYASVTTTGNVLHILRFQDAKWQNVVSITDPVPTGGVVTGIGSFDANRNGGAAVILNGSNGIQYVMYLSGSSSYVAADNNHLMANGELLVSYFQVSLNDDGRIFTTAINDRDQLVLYEFDPVL